MSRGACPMLLLVAAAVVAGCRAAASRSSSTSTDSSGVTVITSLAPAWGEGEEWRLSGEPLLSIGVEEGREEYQLFRVGSAVRLGDGRIVVANLGSNELRFFGPDGAFLFARGGEGDGPGEFRSIWPIMTLGDSLILFDGRLLRLTVLSTGGDLVRTTDVEPAPDGSIPAVGGVFTDGRLLVRSFAAGNPQTVGLSRDTVTWMIYTPDGRFADTLGRFPGDQSYVGREGDLTYGTAAPFGRASTVLAVGERAYFGSSDSWEIQVWRTDGTLERILRRPVPNPSLTARESADFRRSQEERMSRMSPTWRRLYAEMELPATKPAYGRFLVDAERNLWVSEYVRRQSALSPDEGTWVIFDAEGRMLGEVETPPGVRVLQVGDDWLLGVAQDEVQVERVRLFRLIKP